VCQYDTHERTSMIRCSGSEHFDKWNEKARKRTGKNHEYVDDVTWVEYFKHEYSRNYGKRPAEGPSGFGGMYVPGKTKDCEKVRDKLNEVFDPPLWKCTPVCLNKFNRRSKCQEKSRRNRRIRRLDTNVNQYRYDLQYCSTYGSCSTSYVSSRGLVGDQWASDLAEITYSVGDTDDDEFKWRKRTRVVGLDFSDCDCQKEGDSHLTYGVVPEDVPKSSDGNPSENIRSDDIPTSINYVEVGVKGKESTITLDAVTLNGRYAFACNAVTDDVDSFTNNGAADCMDVCHETVKQLRTLEAIQLLEENDTYTPFYIAMGVLIPFWFLLCLCCNYSNYEDPECWQVLSPSLVLTCKVFDWASDWVGI
jgi:hypothetical protein